MKILFFDFGSYMAPDWVGHLQSRGICCKTLYRDIRGQDYYHNETMETLLANTLREGAFDAVLSSNFFPFIGKVCSAQGVKYLAWCYDAPMNLPSMEGFDYPANHIFLFDRAEYQRYRSRGLDTVYHLPLAVNCERLSQVAVYDDVFSCDCSMLGTLYESTLPVLESKMPDYEKGYLDALVRVQTDLYGAWLVEELVTKDFIESVNLHYRALSETAMQITKEQMVYAIATHITHINRVSLLGVLSRSFDVHLCSDAIPVAEQHLLQKVKTHGRIDYVREMPRLFASSGINLNATLRCIQTGIPLRVLDILGCGGFLLSNYQEELSEFFLPDEEIVLYDSMADAYEKAAFYLHREDLRCRIAQKGLERVRQDFRYEDRIETMFRAAGLL